MLSLAINTISYFSRSDRLILFIFEKVSPIYSSLNNQRLSVFFKIKNMFCEKDDWVSLQLTRLHMLFLQSSPYKVEMLYAYFPFCHSKYWQDVCAQSQDLIRLPLMWAWWGGIPPVLSLGATVCVGLAPWWGSECLTPLLLHMSAWRKGRITTQICTETVFTSLGSTAHTWRATGLDPGPWSQTACIESR